MSKWLALVYDNRAAAQELLRTGRFRSSVSRSYYAAYAGIAHLLVGKVTYASGRQNPAHEDILDYIANNLSGIGADRRRNARKAFRTLWRARVDADYRPGIACDRATALAARVVSERVLLEVGIKP